MPGYHIYTIEKGVVGEVSKILEEAHELEDASDQKNKIMQLVEASDLYLAIWRWLDKNHPDIKMTDLHIMAMATKAAFDSGGRV